MRGGGWAFPEPDGGRKNLPIGICPLFESPRTIRRIGKLPAKSGILAIQIPVQSGKLRAADSVFPRGLFGSIVLGRPAAVRVIMAQLRLRFACALLVATGWFSAAGWGQNWAEQMFTSLEHDFGTVAHRTPADFRFEFVNKYKETVHVHSVSTSCKCVAPSVVKDTLNTWDKSEIICKFETDKNFFGARHATVTVRFDKPFWAEVQLQLRGTIRGDLAFDPPLLEFGKVAQGEALTRKVKVTHYGRDANWRIQDIASTYRNVSVRKSEPVVRPDQVSYDLEVTLTDSAPAGTLNEELLVCVGRQGDGTIIERVPLTLKATIAPPVEISPQIVRLGPLKADEQANTKIVLKCQKPFAIKDVMCDDGNFSVTTKEASNGQLHFLELCYVAKDAEAGELKKSITILTDLETAAEICLPVEVTIEERE